MFLEWAGGPADIEARAFEQRHQGRRAGLIDLAPEYAREIIEDGRGAVRHIRRGEFPARATLQGAGRREDGLIRRSAAD